MVFGATHNNQPAAPPGFSARAVAITIDFVLLAVLQFCLLLFTFGRVFHAVIYIEPLAIFALFPAFLVVLMAGSVFLHMFYFTLFHAWSGQTIGKMIVGIKVVTLDNKQVSPAVAFLRWTGYLVSLLPLAAGFLWSAVDKEHCAWHDRLAHTWVVSAEMT